MRTTLSIADGLLEAARQRARESGQTVSSVVEAALRRHLAATPEPSRPPVPVFTGGSGPQPGIDLRSNRALHEALDDGVPLASRA